MTTLNKYDQERFEFMNNVLKKCYKTPTSYVDLSMLRDEDAQFGFRKSINYLIELGYLVMKTDRGFNFYVSNKPLLALDEYQPYTTATIMRFETKIRKEEEKQQKKEEHVEQEIINGVVIPKRVFSPMMDNAETYTNQMREYTKDRKSPKVYIGGTFGMFL